jgi:HPr kinase/phosphorylase
MSQPSVAARENIHATGLVLGSAGIIIRGAPGAGKSLLTLELLDIWEQRQENAYMVSDDRIEIDRGGVGGLEPMLIMHAPKTIAGLIELRGRGIVRRDFVSSAPVHLVVDLVDDLIRMVEEDELQTELLDVTLARCPVPRRGIIDSAHQVLLVHEALRQLGEISGTQ